MARSLRRRSGARKLVSSFVAFVFLFTMTPLGYAQQPVAVQSQEVTASAVASAPAVPPATADVTVPEGTTGDHTEAQSPAEAEATLEAAGTDTLDGDAETPNAVADRDSASEDESAEVFATPVAPKPRKTRPTSGTSASAAGDVKAAGGKVGVSLEAYRADPGNQGWQNGNGFPYQEGDWVPYRLIIGPTDGAAYSYPNDIGVALGHYDKNPDPAVFYDMTKGWRIEHVAAAPAGNDPVNPSLPTFAPDVQDYYPDGGFGTAEWLRRYYNPNRIQIPAGRKYAVIYFEAHLALTVYWRAARGIGGAGSFTGSSGHGRLWNDGKLGSTIPLPAVEKPGGYVNGVKFHDRDRNTTQSAGEEGLGGWVFHLANGDPDFPLNGVTATSAAGTGSFTFGPLPPGTWKVGEELQPNWMPTTQQTSAPGWELTQTVQVGSNQTVNVAFGNALNTLTKKWRLKVGDVLPGTEFFVRYKVSGEDTVTVKLDPAGTEGGYNVYQSTKDFAYGTQITSWTWLATYGGTTVELGSGGPETLTEDPTTNGFTVDTGSVSGTKFVDRNRDGEFTHPSLDGPESGWTIKLYRKVGSSYVLWATAVTADPSGTYSFGGLLPGTYYVEEDIAAMGNYVALSPAGGRYADFAVGSSAVTGKHFYNQPKPVSIEIEKYGNRYAHVGDTVFYQIIVKNTSGTELGNVIVTDPVIGLVHNHGLLALGGSFTIDPWPQHIVQAAPDPLVNVVSVNATSPFEPVNASATHTLDVLNPAIELTKSVSPTKVTDSGDVTYTYEVRNAGDTTLTVNVVDDKLGLITGPGGIELAPGASHTFTKSGVTIAAPTSNVATATGVDVLGGEKGTVRAVDRAHVDVDITKTWKLTLPDPIPAASGFFVRYWVDGEPTDESLADPDGDGVWMATSVLPYGTVIDAWTFFASYGGGEVALRSFESDEGEYLDEARTNDTTFTAGKVSGAKWIDTDLSGDLTFGDAAGPGWTIRLLRGGVAYDSTVTADPSGAYSFGGLLPGSYTLTETLKPAYVAISWPGGFTVPATDQAYEGEEADFLNQPKPVSIEIEKYGNRYAHVGDTVFYQIIVKNTSGTELGNVIVTDPVIGLVHNHGLLALGGSFTIDPWPQHIVQAAPDPLVNVVSVNATSPFEPVNASATHTLDVLNPAIELTKSVSPTKVTDSGDVTYTYEVRNAGDTTLTVNVVDDKLGLITGPGGIELAPGASHTFTKSGVTIAAPTSNVATATGVDVLGGEKGTVRAVDRAHVDVDITKTWKLTLPDPIPAASGFFVRYWVDGEPTDESLADPDGDGVWMATSVLPYGTVIDAWTFFASYGGGEVALRSFESDEGEYLDEARTNDTTFTAGKVSGAKWIDTDLSGDLTFGDAAGPGWTIRLLRGGVAYDSTVTADPSGAYSFGGLLPGSYTLTETLKPAYVAISWPGGFTVPATDQAYEGEEADFLNQPSLVDMAIRKAAAVETADPGATVAYTVDYRNEGSTNATDVVIVDRFNPLYVANVFPSGSPAPVVDLGAGTITWTIGNVAPGGTWSTLSYSLLYRSTMPATSNSVDNTATVYATADSNPTNNTASDSVLVNAAPRLRLDKGAPASAAPGGIVSYTVRYANHGTAPATNFTIEDDYQTAWVASVTNSAGGNTSTAGRIIWTLPGPLTAADGTQTISYSVQLRGYDVFPLGSTSVNNTAIIRLGEVEHDRNSATVVVNTAFDLAVSKQANPTASVPGGAISYTVTVTNLGNDTSPAFTVTDDYDERYLTITNPAGGSVSGGVINWNAAALPPGGTWSVTYTAAVSSAMPAGTTPLVNTVVAVAPGESNTANNTASATVQVIAAPKLTIDKAVLTPAPVKPGATVTYQLTYDNIGNAAATNFTVTDTFSSAYVAEVVDAAGGVVSGNTITWTFAGPYAPDAVPASITYSVRLKGTDAFALGDTSVNNTAVIRRGETVDDTDSAAIVVQSRFDLALDKSAVPASVRPGQAISYTLTVTNIGDDSSPAFTVTDDYDERYLTITNPAGGSVAGGIITWNVGSLAAGGTWSITYTAVASSIMQPGTTPVGNTAIVSAEGDSNTANNSDSALVNVIASVDLSLAKRANVDEQDPGGTVAYTLTYRNIGDAVAENFTITDDFDDTYVDAVVDAGGGTVVGGTIAWTFPGPLTAADGERTVTYSVRLKFAEDFPANVTTSVDNVATIAHPADVNTENNTARETVLVDNPFLPAGTDLAITKVADKETAEPGDEIVYTLTYENLGPAGAVNFTITDDFDERYVTVIDDGGGVVRNGRIAWNIGGPLFAGESDAIVYKVRVSDDMPEGTTNVDNVVVIEDDSDNNPDNDRATERVTVTVDEPFLPFTGGEASLLLLVSALTALAGVGLRRLGRETD